MRPRLAFPAIGLGAIALSTLLLLPRLRGAATRAAPPPEADLVEAAAEIPEPIEAPTSSELPPVPPPSYVRRDAQSDVACSAGMVLVDGIYCPFVGHRCTSFIDEVHDVCATYAHDVLCEGSLQHRRFCVDVYEYPNLAGVYPVVMVDFDAARRACAVEEKRLCTTDEWTFACEGPQMWPYPYGWDRDATACNIDRPHPDPTLTAFSDPWKIGPEIERLDQRVRSGEMTACVSPFGVHDMTGNVDEWTENPDGKRDDKPYRSALKGGYWGPVRDRCRPMTTSHNEWFSFYQAGFRCCSDPLDHAAVAPAPPRPPRRKKKNAISSPP